MTVGMAMQSGVDINMGGWIISETVTLIVTCIAGWLRYVHHSRMQC